MKIRSDTARNAWAGVCLVAALAANSYAKLEPRLESLQGVQAVMIDVSYSKGAVDAGLTEQEQARAVEQQIERAGVKVMPKQFCDKVPGRCRLKVNVQAYRPSGLETFIYTLRLSFVQTVALERSPQTTVDAMTWELTWVAHCPRQRLATTVSEYIETMVDSFIKDYRAANPQPVGETGTAAKARGEGILPLLPNAGKPVPSGAEGMPAGPKAGTASPQSDSETAEQKYIASKSSSVFHKGDCRWAQNISPTNLVTYQTKDEAIKDGKRPCKSCNP